MKMHDGGKTCTKRVQNEGTKKYQDRVAKPNVLIFREIIGGDEGI